MTTTIDIGTYSIKAITGKTGQQPSIKKFAEAYNPLNIAYPVDEEQIKKLSEIVGTFISDNGLDSSDIRVGLPESIVSSHVIDTPPLNDAELASAIGWQAEQHIPIPKENLALEYQVIYRPSKGSNEKMKVLLIGTKKLFVENFVKMFNSLGIEPSVIETQILAAIRTTYATNQDPTSLFVHLGATNTIISVIRQGYPNLIVNVPIGGFLMNKSLEQYLGLDSKQAEEYKRQYGLNQDQFEGKIKDALMPVIQNLTSEMYKAIRFYTSQQPQDSVKRIILSGGPAQLPGLVPYLGQIMNTEVLLISPFSNTSGSKPQNNQSALSVCAGLLMRTDK